MKNLIALLMIMKQKEQLEWTITKQMNKFQVNTDAPIPLDVLRSIRYEKKWKRVYDFHDALSITESIGMVMKASNSKGISRKIRGLSFIPRIRLKIIRDFVRQIQRNWVASWNVLLKRHTTYAQIFILYYI